MDRQELAGQIKPIIEDYLKNQGFGLVDLILRYEGADLFLRILADRPEAGITLEDCAYLNKQISSILDEKDSIKTRYILEVSSPGLDRSLVTREDFLRCLGKTVKFFLRRKVLGKLELQGKIKSAQDQEIEVQINAESVRIPLSDIAKARQIIDKIQGD